MSIISEPIEELRISVIVTPVSVNVNDRAATIARAQIVLWWFTMSLVPAVAPPKAALLRFINELPSTQRLAFEGEAVRLMDEPIEDRIGDRWVVSDSRANARLVIGW
jgi:hypothetical protein